MKDEAMSDRHAYYMAAATAIFTAMLSGYVTDIGTFQKCAMRGEATLLNGATLVCGVKREVPKVKDKEDE